MLQLIKIFHQPLSKKYKVTEIWNSKMNWVQLNKLLQMWNKWGIWNLKPQTSKGQTIGKYAKKKRKRRERNER